METEKVILVDEHDRETGTAGKQEAHEKGLLHRAVSVFLTDHQGRLLIQQRSTEKYHSGGLWANTCCSHPRPGEEPIEAATRRLTEEMGISAGLEPAFTHLYRADVGGGLTEHEFDHVFFGLSDGEPMPHSGEVMDWARLDWLEIDHLLKTHPDRYCPWFHELFHPAWQWFRQQKKG